MFKTPHVLTQKLRLDKINTAGAPTKRHSSLVRMPCDFHLAGSFPVSFSVCTTNQLHRRRRWTRSCAFYYHYVRPTVVAASVPLRQLAYTPLQLLSVVSTPVQAVERVWILKA